jgi:hypothetical protein
LRTPPFTPSITARPALRYAVADWRAFGARRYRPFHLLAVAQGCIGALSGPAILIPLLLGLGAHPALATGLAVLPVVGTMVQRFVPDALERTDGNLRGLVIAAETIGEPRGLLLAAIVALVAIGLLPAGVAIALIAVLMGVLGSLAAVGAGLIQSWYQIVLAEEERRLIGPRLGGITLGIGSLLLLPMSLVFDRMSAAIGLWAYVIPLALGGSAGVAAAVSLRRLPSPGRVRVHRAGRMVVFDDTRLRRLARVLTLASLAAGLCPFLSVYAISVLGTGPGFAIAISAVSSATLVIASLAVSSHLVRGSSSRLLRGSMLLRGGGLLLALAAVPGFAAAPLVLLAVAVLLAAGDTAGQLAANERLFRLATGPSVIAFQSHFVLRNTLAYAGGLLAGSAVMLLGGYAAFAILFAASGTVRFGAAQQTELSPAPRPELEAAAT